MQSKHFSQIAPRLQLKKLVWLCRSHHWCLSLRESLAKDLITRNISSADSGQRELPAFIALVLHKTHDQCCLFAVSSHIVGGVAVHCGCGPTLRGVAHVVLWISTEPSFIQDLLNTSHKSELAVFSTIQSWVTGCDYFACSTR